MKIKQAAATCGLTEKAIRLYEEKGLITPSYTEKNGRQNDENIAQDPGNFFLEEVTDRACQNANGDGKQNGEQGRGIVKLPDVENQLHISKADGEKHRGEQTGKTAVQFFGHTQRRDQPLLGLLFFTLHSRPPKELSINGESLRQIYSPTIIAGNFQKTRG